MPNSLNHARVLVTGGAGAIGGHVVRRLLERGAQVTVVDDLTSGRRSNLPESLAEDAKLIKVTILDPFLPLLFKDRRFEYVVHLAALFANQNSIDHPLEDLQVNAGGTLTLLELARQFPVKRFVYASTSCVTSLSTPYAISKLTGEKYATFYREQHGVPVSVVRYFNSYGPHDYPGEYRSVVPNFFDLATRGCALPIRGSGDETRDFTYVEDIAEGTVRLAEAETHGHCIELGTGSAVTILELATRINEITGNRGGFEIQPRRDWDTVKDRKANLSGCVNVLGWMPSTSLAGGLQRTHEWFKIACLQGTK